VLYVITSPVRFTKNSSMMYERGHVLEAKKILENVMSYTNPNRDHNLETDSEVYENISQILNTHFVE
jgi:hypothetical protein